jgi:hypothetical protein
MHEQKKIDVFTEANSLYFLTSDIQQKLRLARAKTVRHSSGAVEDCKRCSFISSL